MKKLILVALFLQLVIIIREADGYKFGDIIAFPRGCRSLPAFYHYAIYVGPVNENRDNDVGQGDNDIFHRSGDKWLKVHCEFGKLEETRKNSQDKVDNYLEKPGLLPNDDLEWVASLTGRADIIKRINELKNEANCGRYNLINKNCEHLATYVRYGESLSVQTGTVLGPLERRLKKKQNTQALERLEKKLHELRKDQEAVAQCASNPEKCEKECVASASGRNTIVLSACLALLSSFLI